MAISRWWFPVVRYSLVTREYLGGVVTLTVGGCVMALALRMAQPQSARERSRAETRHVHSRY